jgi:hypothetical protein
LGNAVKEQTSRNPAHLHCGLAHNSERWRNEPGHIEVIETDESEIVRHFQTQVLQST